MITFKYFQDKFELVELNFSFKYPAKLLMLIYEKIKHIQPAQLDNEIERLLRVSIVDWNAKYYGKIPPMADLENDLNPVKKIPLEQLARLEVEKIIKAADCYFGDAKKFDNETTNIAVSKYRNATTSGIAALHFDCFDTYYEKKKNLDFVKKDLVELWLDSYKETKVHSAIENSGKLTITEK